MIRDILTVPDGRLTAVCSSSAMMPQDMLHELIRDLFDTCEANNGAGLAAPQIGVLLRVFVIDCGGTRLAFVDPEITKRSTETDVANEGCLSIPGRESRVRRHSRITVEERGHKLKFRGMAARAIQHEMDHLDGILITDESRRG